MTGSVLRNVEVDRPSGAVGRLWWLPAGGQGNGLDDVGWAPLADLFPETVAPVLEALRVAGAAGYVAHVPPRHLGTIAGSTGERRRPSFRLWVGVSTYQTAEDTVASVLRSLDPGGPSTEP